MTQAPLPSDEAQRLEAMRVLGILDTPPDERFDRLTRLAGRLFNVPVALLSLVDTDRTWFKSRMGIDEEEVPRDVSFCTHAIDGERVLVVEDAEAHELFHDNPLVRGGPGFRFYAGRTVRAPNGAPLGTLCMCARHGAQRRDWR